MVDVAPGAEESHPASPEILTTTAVLELVGVSKRYGSLRAVDDVSLSVDQGSVFGLLGPNGAGKSTLLSIAAGVLRPSSGTARVNGHSTTRRARQVRRQVGYVPDQLGVYEQLNVSEYLEFFAAANRLPPDNRGEVIAGVLELVELSHKRDAWVDTLSRGMKQRLSVARALLHEPSLLVMDEPASGLDPRSHDELGELIGHLSTLGTTVLISSHAVDEMAQWCSHLGLMSAGRLTHVGATSELVGRLHHRSAVPRAVPRAD